MASDNSQNISQIIAKYPSGRENLIPMLQDIQEQQGFLSQQAVRELSQLTEISENEIYGVGTFYTQFRFTPPGEHTIRVCLGTACHVRGGHKVLSECEEKLGISAGETTQDQKFGLERVACIGCCALAPAAVVDGEVHARMTPRKIRTVISRTTRKSTGNGGKTA